MRPHPAARVYRHEDLERVRKVNRGTLRLLLAILDEDEEFPVPQRVDETVRRVRFCDHDGCTLPAQPGSDFCHEHGGLK